MENSIILGLIIETRFIGPTDTKGSRISAVCKRDSERTYRKTVAWNHGKESGDNHRAAAEAVMAVMDTTTSFSVELTELATTWPTSPSESAVGQVSGRRSGACHSHRLLDRLAFGRVTLGLLLCSFRP